MKKFLTEFKDFAMRGNVLDLAIGVVIGGAFSSIITSLVNDIIMPFISLVVGSGSLAKSAILLKEAGEQSIYLSYGNFLQALLNFILIAFSIFVLVKMINRFVKKKEAEQPAPTKTDEAILLEAILQELKDKH